MILDISSIRIEFISGQIIGGGTTRSRIGYEHLHWIARISVVSDQEFEKRGEGVGLTIDGPGIEDSVFTIGFRLFETLSVVDNQGTEIIDRNLNELSSSEDLNFIEKEQNILLIGSFGL